MTNDDLTNARGHRCPNVDTHQYPAESTLDVTELNYLLHQELIVHCSNYTYILHDYMYV